MGTLLPWITLLVLLVGCSFPDEEPKLRRSPLADAGGRADVAGDARDGAPATDACPPGRCGAPAGSACRWDLDCRAGLVCDGGTCVRAVDPGPDAARPSRDSGGERADLGPAPVDLGRPGLDQGPDPEPDLGGPGDCVEPGEGCPAVCGEPPCSERCGDVDGDRFITVCDAHYLAQGPRLTVCQQIMGDLDLDGDTDMADAQLILDYVRTGDAALLGCAALPPGL